MRRLIGLVVLAVVLFANGVALASTCGAGVTCFSSTIALTNANASQAYVAVPAYTAPANGFGVKISAIWAYPNVTMGNQSRLAFYIIHAGVPYQLFFNDYTVNVATNCLLSSYSGATSLPNAPTDEYGNPYIYLAPGDSLGVAHGWGIPASGPTSGTYNIIVEGQSY